MAAYTTIDDSSAHFQTLTYTGNGSHPRNLTNDGNSDLKPDLIWSKNRTDNGTNNVITSSSFGFDAPNATFEGGSGNDETLNGQISTDSTAKQNNPSATYGYISGHLTDGFTAAAGGTNGDTMNANNKEFVAWQWKANAGTTSTNTDGDINSTVQLNTDAGFSIVKYEPTNTTARNIGHGLGKTPGVIIIRNRQRIENWRLWHQDIGAGGATFDSDAAYNTSATTLINTVNSTIFNVGSDFSVNGAFPLVAFCWAEVQGYSKFGSYYGNSNTNGAFIYTGFKPGFIILKQTSGSGNGWFAFDTKRDVSNTSVSRYLRVDETGAEGGASKILDMYSNGFKIIHADNATNGSGHRYLYMAFAESPFVTSTGVPTTAL